MEKYDWLISRTTVRDVPRLFVFFDLDNTLVDRRGTLADWSAEFTARHDLADEEQAHVLGEVTPKVPTLPFYAARSSR
ncbi:hypothetical protein ACF065_31545 [Streptomyces sp. NPDC015232]|uniref:hypothetical protein n=1 Tax=unclassified Streptomyces TaxID=2593676 RepID=UPI003703090E